MTERILEQFHPRRRRALRKILAGVAIPVIAAFAVESLMPVAARAECVAPAAGPSPAPVILAGPVAPVTPAGPPAPVIPACSSFSVNASPDPSRTDPSAPATLYVGTGIPATNFGI